LHNPSRASDWHVSSEGDDPPDYGTQDLHPSNLHKLTMFTHTYWKKSAPCSGKRWASSFFM
jgi:hypothetical protein